MKVFDLQLAKEGFFSKAILVKSYSEYKENGGTKDIFDVYSKIKERAKSAESMYIDMMDQALSGIPINSEDIVAQRNIAQMQWFILALWFNKPLRLVDYKKFDLKKFDEL